MTRRLFLHIGPPKTGTSFLQAAWFKHRREMADQGVLYAGDQLMDQFRASAVVLGKRRVVDRMPPEHLTAWTRIADAVRAWDGDAIMSSEHYAIGSPHQVDDVIEEVNGLADEVHLLVTVRDLGRLLPAAWQQSVKQGSAQTFDEFWRTRVDDPDHSFWRAQDLPTMLDRWTTTIPAERVHLVVHGPSGSPRDLLWERVCSVTGVDATILGPVHLTNESVGVTQIEFLRRVNADLPADRDRVDMGRMTKSFVTNRVLSQTGSKSSFALPEAVHDSLVKHGQDVVAALRDRGYDVVGDLDDLVPAPASGLGRAPDSVTDTEVAEVASEAFARLMVLNLESRRDEQKLRAQIRRLRRASPAPESVGLRARVRRRLGR
jgi:hypothetical protein